MDYNDFIKTVQDQLIPLEREVVNTFRSAYNIDKLGYTKASGDGKDIILNRINNTKEEIRGLEASDAELDVLAQMAVDSFKDLSDLGMQVDSRFSSEIFSVASNMLGHAITAKTAKLNKKLKMIDLQLKKASLDQKLAGKAEEIENTPVGEGKALDRNELLKMLATKTNEQ